METVIKVLKGLLFLWFYTILVIGTLTLITFLIFKAM